jgi:hypothetical protein
MRRVNQPSFSSNLVLLDFYLFDKLKITLIGLEFEDEQGRLNAMMTVLNAITQDEVESVFEK